MNVEELKKQLDEAGISYTNRAKKEELEKLLPPETVASNEDETPPVGEESDVEDKGGSGDFDVKDPQVIRPEQLPLVITPKSGKWANSAQEEYSRTLNAYAYKNPEKWSKKKDKLLKKLSDLAKNPEKIAEYRGNLGKVSYQNQLIQTQEDHE